MFIRALLPFAALCLGCAGLAPSPRPEPALDGLVSAAPGRATWEAMQGPTWPLPTLETVDGRDVCGVVMPQDGDIVAELTFSTRGDASDPRCDLLLEHTLRGRSTSDTFVLQEKVARRAGELRRCPDWLRGGGPKHQDLWCARRSYVDGPRTYVLVQEEPRLGWEVSHTVRLRDLDYWLKGQE